MQIMKIQGQKKILQYCCFSSPCIVLKQSHKCPLTDNNTNSLLGLYWGSQFSPWVSQSLSVCAVSYGDARGGLEIAGGLWLELWFMIVS